ncbi:IS200/IS605 family transposase [Chloroflexia bacterium SDU3-3]|nr:IS200/IS605 family transposase [Chloroflexia bacterium SDU3-3]
MELRQSNKPYHTDHSIVYSCQYHVIFCPKYRRKVLTDGVATRMKELVFSKQADYGYSVIEMDVMPDHVHLLLDVDPRAGINVVVGKIKGFTSHELRNEFPWLKKRLPTLWTRSKFISTVGAVTLDSVQQYIESQKGV